MKHREKDTEEVFEELESLQTIPLEQESSIIGGAGTSVEQHGSFLSEPHQIGGVPDPGHATLGAAESEAIEQISKDFAESADFNPVTRDLSMQEITTDVDKAFENQGINNGALQGVHNMNDALGMMEQKAVGEVEAQTGVQAGQELLHALVSTVDAGITTDENSYYNLSTTIDTSSTRVNKEIAQDLSSLVSSNPSLTYSQIVEGAKDSVEDAEGLTASIVSNLVQQDVNSSVHLEVQNKDMSVSDFFQASQGFYQSEASMAVSAEGGTTFTADARAQEITNMVSDVENSTPIAHIQSEIDKIADIDKASNVFLNIDGKVIETIIEASNDGGDD